MQFTHLAIALIAASIAFTPLAAPAAEKCLVYEPVCGIDGTRYPNACWAHAFKTTPRKGGALIEFTDAGGTFWIWSENDTFIDEAMLKASGQSPQQVPVFNSLLQGTDCTSPYSFHVDAANMHFTDFAAELCDATAELIEADLDYWLYTVGYWCPWSAEVVSVWDHR